MRDIRALSLSRPWPWAFLHAPSPKRVENRSDKRGMPPMCSYRGPLLLHAAKSWDAGAFGWMAGRGLLDSYDDLLPLANREHPAGVIFARCRVVGYIAPDPGCSVGYPAQHFGEHQEDDLDMRWWMGGYALVLADVRPTPLVACKGSLGLWRPPPNVLEQLEGKDGT